MGEQIKGQVLIHHGDLPAGTFTEGNGCPARRPDIAAVEMEYIDVSADPANGDVLCAIRHVCNDQA